MFLPATFRNEEKLKYDLKTNDQLCAKHALNNSQFKTNSK